MNFADASQNVPSDINFEVKGVIPSIFSFQLQMFKNILKSQGTLKGDTNVSRKAHNNEKSQEIS